MKKIVCLLIVMLLSIGVLAQHDFPNRGNGGGDRQVQANFTPSMDRDMLLAPTTWGFFAHYYSTYFGSGSYTFRVDNTYAGVNSIFGYQSNFYYSWRSNVITALYVFDLSGVVDPFTSAAFTMQATSARNAMTLSFFDAEDFGLENATPWADPSLVFGPLPAAIGTANLTGGGAVDMVEAADVKGSTTPDGGYCGFVIDLSDTPAADYDWVAFSDANLFLGTLEVPTLSVWGLIALCGFLMAGGVWFMIRRR